MKVQQRCRGVVAPRRDVRVEPHRGADHGPRHALVVNALIELRLRRHNAIARLEQSGSDVSISLDALATQPAVGRRAQDHRVIRLAI